VARLLAEDTKAMRPPSPLMLGAVAAALATVPLALALTSVTGPEAPRVLMSLTKTSAAEPVAAAARLLAAVWKAILVPSRLMLGALRRRWPGRRRCWRWRARWG